MIYSTVYDIYCVWLCSIATDKVLIDKQEEIKILQEKITSLTIQVRESKEKNSNLMENMKGKQLLSILIISDNLISSTVSDGTVT